VLFARRKKTGEYYLRKITVLMDITTEKLATLFPGMESGLKEAILSEGHVKNVKEGELLVSSGQYIKSAMLVIDGLVKVSREDEDGKEFLMYYLEPGSACALSLLCAARSEKSAISAKAVSDVTIITVPFVLTETWQTRYRTWHEFVVATYRKRFEELLITLDSVAFKSMDERLVFYLKRQMKVSGKLLAISHQEIANDLSTAREVVSRLLKKLEQSGAIVLSRNHIEIINLDKIFD
jgi:CRP/FNR family transcriptional regulator, anaerobic regulatory protein